MSTFVRNIFIFVLLFWQLNSFAQGKYESLKIADIAFEQKDYTTAAHFYRRALVDIDNAPIVIYPYDYTYYVKPLEEPELDSAEAAKAAAVKDSLAKLPPPIIQLPDSMPNVKVNEENLPYVIRMADSYRMSYTYNQAKNWYAYLIAKFKTEDEHVRYWYGHMLVQDEQYDNAITYLKELQKKIAKDSPFYPLVDADIKNAAFARKALKKGTENTIEKMPDLMNSGMSAQSVSFLNEQQTELLYSKAVYNPMATQQPNLPQLDLMVTAFDDETYTSGNTIPFAEAVNSKSNEGSPVMSADGNIVYFTRCENGNCAIYMSKRLFNKWMQPQRLGPNINQAGYSSMHPAFSADGTTLFFSSNRQGSIGGYDIWTTTVNEFGETTEPVNLSKRVNTKGNEISPYFHAASNTLYFSSDGQVGMGGYDIYRTFPDKNYTSVVENIGPPINSGKDDSYFILNTSENIGFLTSDRESCEDCLENSNCNRIYKVNNSPFKITISGFVYSSETNTKIPNALIEFTDEYDRLEPFFAFADEYGFYSTTIRGGFDYFITARKARFFKDSASVQTMDIKETTHFDQDFYLDPLRDFILPIEYDYDKATLRPISMEILDNLTKFLELNNHITIEIGAHTDERGTDEYNIALSDARAKSVYDYLITKDVAADRLKSKGYGETELLVKNAQTEEDHQRNRRTMFKILSEDYQP